MENPTVFEDVPGLTLEERLALDAFGAVVHAHCRMMSTEGFKDLIRALNKVEEAGQHLVVSGDSRHLAIGKAGGYTLVAEKSYWDWLKSL